MPKYFNVIIVCQWDECGLQREQFLKYHGVKNDRLPNFWKFAAKIPNLHHVNFYEKRSKAFVKQVKATDILNGCASV